MTQLSIGQHGSLVGKVFAITGGASGIGLATSKMLSVRGATVAIADIDADAIKVAEAHFASLGVPCTVSKVDVSKRCEVDSWIEFVVQTHGRLDGAANVAGVIGTAHGIAAVDELDDDEWNKIMAVNLTGTMYCLRAQLRNIVDCGSIVNVSSIHGLKGLSQSAVRSSSFRRLSLIIKLLYPSGFARHAAYDASKHGMIGLTKAAALEYGSREIRINSVAPGAIYTPLMQKNWDCNGRPQDAPFDEPTAFKRQGTAEEVANVIVFLLGPDSSFVSGSVYSVDGAWI